MIPAWLLPDFDVRRYGVPTTTRVHSHAAEFEYAAFDDNAEAQQERIRQHIANRERFKDGAKKANKARQERITAECLALGETRDDRRRRLGRITSLARYHRMKKAKA